MYIKYMVANVKKLNEIICTDISEKRMVNNYRKSGTVSVIN